MANRKLKSKPYRIENEMDYNATMKKIDALMKKGESKLTNKEAEELRILAGNIGFATSIPNTN